MAVPSTNPAGGIFQNLVQPQGSLSDVQRAKMAIDVLAQSADPRIAAYYKAWNLLPEGELKKWLSLNPFDWIGQIVKLFTGRKYTTGQYILGERLIDQIQGGNVGRSQVPDEAVPAAQTLFTILFGVRITTNEDLDAIHFSPQKYYERGEKNDIPLDAVERAVFLATNFYTFDTYNQGQWDLRYFEAYPLVAPIPGLQEGTLFTGELPGGARCVNGIIPVDAQTILKQIPGSDFDPNTGSITTPTGEILAPGSGSGSSGSVLDSLISYVKANPLIGALVIGGVGYAAIELEENGDLW